MQEETLLDRSAVEDIAEEISGTLQGAFDILVERRDTAYADAIGGLESEAAELRKEYAAIEKAAGDLAAVLPAQAREAQRQADVLLLAGKHQEAQAKLAEQREAETAPAIMKARQRAISARLEQVAGEKQAIAKTVFEQFYLEAQQIVRAVETGFFVALLDGLERDSYDFQQRTGIPTNPILQQNRLAGLTAPERSIEWRTGQKWYKGRR